MPTSQLPTTTKALAWLPRLAARLEAEGARALAADVRELQSFTNITGGPDPYWTHTDVDIFVTGPLTAAIAVADAAEHIASILEEIARADLCEEVVVHYLGENALEPAVRHQIVPRPEGLDGLPNALPRPRLESVGP